MSTNVRIAAILLPVALLCSAGCKSKSTNPEPASSTASSAAAPAATPGSTAPAASNGTATSTAPAAVPAAAPSVATAAPASTPVAPAAAAVPAPPPRPTTVVVPAGTVLRVRLVQPLGSKISEEGQRFDASLADPVVVRGNRVVPPGISAVGTVTEAHPAGRFKGGATLSVQLNSLRIDGTSYPIRTNTVAQVSKGKGKRTATMIGGGGGAGALIGGLAGGGKGALIGGLIGAGAGTAGAATGNRDIVLGSESSLTFRLQSSVTLPLRRYADSGRRPLRPENP